MSEKNLSGIDLRLQNFFHNLKQYFPGAFIGETYRSPEEQRKIFDRKDGSTYTTDSAHSHWKAIHIDGIDYSDSKNISLINYILTFHPSIKWGHYFKIKKDGILKSFRDSHHFEIKNYKNDNFIHIGDVLFYTLTMIGMYQVFIFLREKKKNGKR